MSSDYYGEFFSDQQRPCKKLKRFVVETEWDLRFWSLLPQINWNRHFYEIELRWLCAGIMFRDDKKFHYESIVKPFEKEQKSKIEAALKAFGESLKKFQ